MSILLSALQRGERSGVSSVDDYIAAMSEFVFNGVANGVSQTLVGDTNAEKPGGNFAALAQSAYAANGVVFACMLVRQLVFSAVRFSYQRMRNGRGSDLWGDQSLSLVERPWHGGTTQDLLSRMIQDADLAGNSYWVRDGDEMVRLRPDWVSIVTRRRKINGGRVGHQKVGYLYYEGGESQAKEPVAFLADEVAHFAPVPDPLASYRGMTWLTPIIRDIQSDGLMSRHKRRFFDNGATPNMVVKHGEKATPDSVRKFRDMLDREHRGIENAYKTLHVGGGADVTLVGRDFRQIDFRAVQGAGETRIAAAAGVPPVIVGLSEGLQAATYSNYAQARRRFADGTMHPLWGNASGSLEVILPAPLSKFDDGGFSRLWYDSRDVPFLREDEKDAAEIQGRRATTIKTLTDAGFTPDSVITAVDADDMRLLVHSGLYSVQLQPPGLGALPALPSGGDDAQ